MDMPLSPTLRLLLGTASFIIIIAGMKASAELLVPFLLSAFIAILCAPPIFWLEEKKLPTVAAVSIVVSLIVLAGTLISAVVGASISDFADQLPEYQERLQADKAQLIDWLNGKGINTPTQILTEQLNPSAIMELVKNILSGLGGVLTDSFLILLTVLFILFEVSSFPAKYRRALKNPDHSFNSFTQFNRSVKQYLLIKSWVSLATGTIIGLWLALLDVDYAILWALLAFMFNFIPNIGSILAAVPAVLLAFIQLGSGVAALAALGFLTVNIVMGNVIEPRFMGRGLGLSTLVVFLSLIFWGWVLGPVGMLLSIPLTMIVKIALESHENTHWVAVLLNHE